MFIFKILAFLWPFLREMILEKKTLGEAIKTNKKKVLLIFVILGSVGLNLFIVPKLVSIAEEDVKLRQANAALQVQMTNLSKQYAANCTPVPAVATASVTTATPPTTPPAAIPSTQPVPVPSSPAAPKKKPNTKPQPQPADQRYTDVMEQLRKLQHHEEDRNR